MLKQIAFCLALSATAQLHAQTTAPEARASAAFEAARRAGPLALHAFLDNMPKGADLHMHLSGAVYAETFLKDAVADNLCIDPAKRAFAKPTNNACPANTVPAANAFKDQTLYDALVDSFSMRAFVPSSGIDGHDQFFATFGRFGGLGDHNAEWLDEVATRAATQNEQYLEVMITPSFTHAATLGYQIGWPTPPQTFSGSETGDIGGTSHAELAALRDKLLAAGLRDEIATDRTQLDGALARRRQLEHCDTAAATLGCTVEVRVIYQVLRAFPPQQVFAQTLLAFEVASADPNVVGLNFVQPEDAYMSMSEYHRQMLMLDYLHSVYPKVHISLHAGELAPGLVPPAGLRFHIWQAVGLAHAERIGHGVDIMQEATPKQLLKQLADQHIMVEINLTSNDVILGIVPPQHPFLEYRRAHVPVALSTDDEGVSRIDLTHEYTRAALEYKLSYTDLKQMARTSLEHSFLPGPSLWTFPDNFTIANRQCHLSLPISDPSPACLDFLKSSEKATQQWELEHRFRAFESSLP
jgi:adenosine deaminase